MLASRVGEGWGVGQLCLHSVTQPYTTWPRWREQVGGLRSLPLVWVGLLHPPPPPPNPISQLISVIPAKTTLHWSPSSSVVQQRELGRMSSYELLVSGLFFILVLLWFFRQHKRTQCWNRVGIGLSYRPARLYRLVESILGHLNSLKTGAQNYQISQKRDCMTQLWFLTTKLLYFLRVSLALKSISLEIRRLQQFPIWYWRRFSF